MRAGAAIGGNLPLGVGLVSAAFTLRLIFASLSVRLPEVVRATGMDVWRVGLITTLPVLCLGVFAPLAPKLARIWGSERVLAGALLLIAAGTALRALGPVWALFSFSLLAGAAIATANVLLPALVKRHFEGRTALMTGAYVTAISAGAALAAAVTIPIESMIGGGWRTGLAMWALPAIAAFLIWAPQARRRGPSEGGVVLPVRGLWTSGLAWSVALFMGLQSALAFSALSWLAPLLRERGLSAETAGLVVSVLVVVQLLTCLTTPALAMRQRDQRGLAVGLSIGGVTGLLGMLLAPLGQVWVWALVQGLAQGGLFSLALTFVLLRSSDSHVAAHLSGMSQAVGYIPAAFAPFAIATLQLAKAGLAGVALLFVAIGLGLVVTGLRAGRTGFAPAKSVPAAPGLVGKIASRTRAAR